MLADLFAPSGVTTKFLSNIGATLRTKRSPLQSSGTVNLQKIAASPSHASPPSPPLIYVAQVAQAKYLPRDRASVSSLALVAFAHLAVVYLLMLSPAREALENVSAVMVTLIHEPALAPRTAEKSPSPRPVWLQQISTAPVPTPEVTIDSAAADTSTVSATRDTTAPSVALALSPAAVVPPRYDAAYLHNPAPAYPPLSKRFREQGIVMLRVRVSAAGLAEQIDLETSSGSPRLDAAAIEAVKQWRFIPAKRGNDAMAGWALVPINFRLA